MQDRITSKSWRRGLSKPLYAKIATSNAQIKHTCKSNTSVTCSLLVNVRSVRTISSMFHHVSIFTKLLMFPAYPAFSSLCYSIINDIVAVADVWAENKCTKGLRQTAAGDQNSRHVPFNNKCGKCDNGQLHAWHSFQVANQWRLRNDHFQTEPWVLVMFKYDTKCFCINASYHL